MTTTLSRKELQAQSAVTRASLHSLWTNLFRKRLSTGESYNAAAKALRADVAKDMKVAPQEAAHMRVAWGEFETKIRTFSLFGTK